MNTIPPDEHLRQALRHAPDGDVGAPAELSAQILAAAHRSAAARPAAPTAEPSDWRRWLATLWARPGASAALASVVLVGFIGLMWRGDLPGPATDEGPARALPAAAGKAAVEPSPAESPALDPGAKPKVPLSAEMAGKSAPPSAASSSRDGFQQEATAAAAAPKGIPNATTRTTEALATAAPVATRAAIGSATEPGAGLRPQPAEIAPVVADPPRAADLAVQDGARSAPASTPAPAPAPAPPPAATNAAATAAAPLTVSGAPAGRALRARSELAAAPAAGASLLKAAQPVAEAGSRPDLPWQENATSGQRWHWQPPGAWRDPDAAWWAALARLAQGRWQAASDAQPAPDAFQLQGQRGAENLGRLWLEPASLLWCGPTPPCQRAPLPPEVRRELLEALAR
jgi:hypothetical protein